LLGWSKRVQVNFEAWRQFPGDRDVMTPPSEARRMRALMRQARLRIFRGGTHYTPVEYPQEVCEELRQLFMAADRNA
jgi:pimeloyl-ACP methyl ester carboxylesterase